MPQIQLLDGKKIDFDKSIDGFELTKKISKSLEKIALIMEVDGELKDLSHKITKDSKVKIITPKDQDFEAQKARDMKQDVQEGISTAYGSTKSSYQKLESAKLVIKHTEVDRSLEGQGIAKKLLEEVAAFARDKNYKILPICPFAKNIMYKYPEQYKDLL